MNKKTILIAALVLVALWCGLSTFAQRDAATRLSTAEIAAAANAFLATLDDAERGKVVYEFGDNTQRARWSNLPVGMAERGGLRLGDLTSAQREAAMAVLAAALSAEGYQKVVAIVEADEVLKSTSSGGRGGGRSPSFGRDEYYISFLGRPSATEPWIIQFGGHHLGINVMFAGENGTLAPSHTGVQPARYELEGKTVRPLGGEVDKAHALVSSLSEAQRAKAILGVQMRDLVLGPGRDGQTIEPEGIKGSELTGAQREQLAGLIAEWVGIMRDALAATKMEEVRKNLGETHFAWSGPTEAGAAAYFRIQGPTVFIELAPQRLGGDPTNHIHTIYRDFTNEYGAKWWRP